jgi:LPS O-antigen subunit length determinant protein (WzzB/FepE family)
VNPQLKIAAVGLGVESNSAQPSATRRMLRQVFRTKVTVIGTVIVIVLVIFALIVDLLPLEDPYIIGYG